MDSPPRAPCPSCGKMSGLTGADGGLCLACGNKPMTQKPRVTFDTRTLLIGLAVGLIVWLLVGLVVALIVLTATGNL